MLTKQNTKKKTLKTQTFSEILAASERSRINMNNARKAYIG
jgi:hypothetical protein